MAGGEARNGNDGGAVFAPGAAPGGCLAAPCEGGRRAGSKMNCRLSDRGPATVIVKVPVTLRTQALPYGGARSRPARTTRANLDLDGFRGAVCGADGRATAQATGASPQTNGGPAGFLHSRRDQYPGWKTGRGSSSR